jgi:hypothetical protein
MDSFVKTVNNYIFDAEDYFFGVDREERKRRRVGWVEDEYRKQFDSFIQKAKDYLFGVSEAEQMRRDRQKWSCSLFQESIDHTLYRHSRSLLRQAREQRERGEKVNPDYELARQEDMIESTERLVEELPFPGCVLIRRHIGTMNTRLEYRVKRRKRYESILDDLL